MGFDKPNLGWNVLNQWHIYDAQMPLHNNTKVNFLPSFISQLYRHFWGQINKGEELLTSRQTLSWRQQAVHFWLLVKVTTSSQCSRLFSVSCCVLHKINVACRMMQKGQLFPNSSGLVTIICDAAREQPHNYFKTRFYHQ